MTNINTKKIGLIYLGVYLEASGSSGITSLSYPCASVEYNMSIDNIPTVEAIVGAGINLAQNFNAPISPLVFAHLVQESDYLGASKSLYPCALYEEQVGSLDTEKLKVIFKGYIVESSIEYQADKQSAMQVKFICQGLAVALSMVPFIGYIETEMGALINRLNHKGKIDLETALSKTANFELQKYNARNILMQDKGQKKLKNTTIADRIAICVKAVRLAGSWKTLKLFDFTKDTETAAAFGGQTKLKLSGGISDQSDMEYTIEIINALITEMQNVNIFSAIKNILTSPNFALQLIPRWTCDEKDDFKMEIMPVTAWKPRRPIIKLNKYDIASITMRHVSSTKLTTPDVVIVNMHHAYTAELGNNNNTPLGIWGVAAQDKDLEKKLREVINASVTTTDTTDLLKFYKVREFNAPSWLAAISVKPGAMEEGKRDTTTTTDAATTDQAASNLTEGEGTPENLSEEEKDNGTGTTPYIKKSADGNTIVQNAADVMARALFLHYFKALDSVTVIFMPTLRFGRQKGIFLENSLGDTVEIDLSDVNPQMPDLTLTGVLSSLNYTYYAGASSRVLYSGVIERVRFSPDDIPTEECPIYSVGDYKDE